ncbi:hypothetical protein C8Q75DRAFT_783042 [Abortiporus biennis]|nr:hypothetical protein C8Q75DRAFT_783042 [Abortiporus biennis]
MFEKFSISDIDSAGRGGEYTVQAGFGWTNGVVLWIASVYGNVLVAPTCPNITVLADGSNGAVNGGGSSSSGAASVVLGSGLVMSLGSVLVVSKVLLDLVL